MESKRNVGSFLHWISSLFSKNKREYDGLEQMRMRKQDPRCLKFTVEVDDTGVGIPKEKRQSVFENYVQVKETAVGTGGTGFGLGIVQSLGGEIEILDKVHDERGTCFNFNVFLLVCDETSPPPSIEFSLKANSEHDYQHAISDELCLDSGQKNNTFSGIVILIQNSVRRRMVQEYMESQGIRPEALRKGSELSSALKKIKEKILSKTLVSSSGLLDLSPRSCLSTDASSSGLPKKLPMSSMEGKAIVPSHGLGRRALSKGSLSFVLIIIDTAAGDFNELSTSVAEFRKDLYGNSNASCKVVWLEKPETREHHFRGLNEDTAAGDFSELSRSVAEFRKDLYGNSNASCKVVWLEMPETREHRFRGLNEDAAVGVFSELSRSVSKFRKDLYGMFLVSWSGLRSRRHESTIFEDSMETLLQEISASSLDQLSSEKTFMEIVIPLVRWSGLRSRRHESTVFEDSMKTLL